MAQSRKEELIEDLRRQRQSLSARGETLKRELRPGNVLRKSVQEHPFGWALSAGIGSFLIARAFRRRTVVAPKKRSGLFMTLAKLAFKLARPSLTAMAIQKGQQILESRFNPPPDNSRLGGPPQK